MLAKLIENFLILNSVVPYYRFRAMDDRLVVLGGLRVHIGLGLSRAMVSNQG